MDCMFGFKEHGKGLFMQTWKKLFAVFLFITCHSSFSLAGRFPEGDIRNPIIKGGLTITPSLVRGVESLRGPMGPSSTLISAVEDFRTGQKTYVWKVEEDTCCLIGGMMDHTKATHTVVQVTEPDGSLSRRIHDFSMDTKRYGVVSPTSSQIKLSAQKFSGGELRVYGNFLGSPFHQLSIKGLGKIREFEIYGVRQSASSNGQQELVLHVTNDKGEIHQVIVRIRLEDKGNDIEMFDYYSGDVAINTYPVDSRRLPLEVRDFLTEIDAQKIEKSVDQEIGGFGSSR